MRKMSKKNIEAGVKSWISPRKKTEKESSEVCRVFNYVSGYEYIILSVNLIF